MFAQDWTQDEHADIRNAAIPVYLDFEAQPAAVLRADHIFSDYQTRGFFRIGVLRAVVLERATLEIRDVGRLTNALERVTSRLAAGRELTSAIEARQFCLCFPSTRDGRVSAKLLHLHSGSQWTLLDGTVERPGVAPVKFHSATLTISGPGAGELTCQTHDGASRIQLLSLVRSSSNNQNSNNKLWKIPATQ